MTGTITGSRANLPLPEKYANLPLPEKYALSGSEDAHQISLFMWAALPIVREQYPELKWLFAIPNGGLRNKSTAARLKAMGVKRGVPDICLLVRRGQFAALWIELKRPANKATKRREGKTQSEQNEWIDYLKTQGHGSAICVGWEQARDMIKAYLDWKEE